MAKFRITGRKKLAGEYQVTGAKNAALKMVAAAIMIPGKVVLHNVPRILDIFRMIEVIESIGAKTDFQDNSLTIDSTDVNSFSPDAGPVNKLRGSVVIIGPLLSRFGKANFSEPGGCLIGARPIDFHLKAFADLGVSVDQDEKTMRYHLSDNGSFRQGDKTVVLEEMSVTTTENVIMASVLRQGRTTIEIAACEPEIVDLVEMLNKAGAKISGAGTHTIIVDGVENLHDVKHTIIPDRIEAGTIAIAAAVSGGKVAIKNIVPKHLSLVLNKFRSAKMNFSLKYIDDTYADLTIDQQHSLVAVNIDTRPYPGFPTDLQSPFAILMTQAKGNSRIFETLFSARFDYVKWLIKMAAKIEIQSPHIIDISGPTKLSGKNIECSDLRGGAALVLAGLCAEGETIVENIEFIDRGYENFDLRLKNLGAGIERVG